MRIEEDGGEVLYSDRARVNGELPISRVLGNLYAKPYVVSTPQIAECALQYNDLVVLASDGIWDVMSNEDVSCVIAQTLGEQMNVIDEKYPQKPSLRNKQSDTSTYEGGSDRMLKRAARALRDEAYLQGSTDNISAILFKIKPNE